MKLRNTACRNSSPLLDSILGIWLLCSRSSTRPRYCMAVSPSSRSGRGTSRLRLREFEWDAAAVVPDKPFVPIDPCRGECGSLFRKRLLRLNMLLRLLRPAVEVEFRPLPPFAKGGVGGG